MATEKRSRREVMQLAGAGLFGLGALQSSAASARALGQAAESDSHIGNLYPFVQKQADRSPLELSCLRAESRDLERWQTRARA